MSKPSFAKEKKKKRQISLLNLGMLFGLGGMRGNVFVNTI